MTSRRDDAGMTIIELVVAIIVLGIIIVPLSTSVIIGLATTQRAAQRTTDTTDQQLLASYFLYDVQSAADVSTTSPGCGGANTILQLHWVDPVDGLDRKAAYVADPAGTLDRVYCDSSGATRTTSMVAAVQSAPSPRCDGVACSAAQPGGTPRNVSMQVSTVGSKSGASYETYTFTLSATRRVTP